MQLVLTSPVLWLCVPLAAVMGFAIQRGATCTVAAMDEVINKRRANRLVSLVEASLWVVGGLAIAQALSLLVATPAGFGVNGLTIAGAALLGVGAYVNGACVFGAIARFGSGEWAFALTPVGFYVGCVTIASLPKPAPTKLDAGSPVLIASMWLAIPFALAMIARVARALQVPRGAMSRTIFERARECLSAHIWSPHSATAVIGITFFFMLVLAGAWAYTDVLAELARGMHASLVPRLLLLVALYVGALIGGRTASRLRGTPPSPTQLVKCFAGGVLMGWGSLMIPGSNDGLILVGMPLLWPYAWVAFATMCASIAAAMLVVKAVRGAAGGRHAEQR